MQQWTQFIDDQSSTIGKEAVDKWLRPLRVLKFDACNLYLEADDAFQVAWFREQIFPRLTTFKNNNQKLIKVHLTIKGSPSESKKDSSPKKNPSSTYDSSRSSSTSSAQSENYIEPFSFKLAGLNPFATFENFIEVDSLNLLPFQLAKEAISTDYPTYNPIYFYGPKASGKTHLLMSMAAAWRAQNRSALYVQAELFTEHLVNAIRAGEMHAFRSLYRNLDALLIDNVQVFARKGATQEELFHTFNTLHTEGKQIILAGELPPKELRDIEARLISRFEWGIVMPLDTLPTSYLQELFRRRTLGTHLKLSPEGQEFLLSAFPSPLQLMQALEAILFRKRNELSPQMIPLDRTDLHTLLGDLLEKHRQILLTAEELTKIVAKEFQVSYNDLLGKTQAREVSLPRKVAIFLCRIELQLPFMKIGSFFSRDHSTIMSSSRSIQKAWDEGDLYVMNGILAILKYLESHYQWKPHLSVQNLAMTSPTK